MKGARSGVLGGATNAAVEPGSRHALLAAAPGRRAGQLQQALKCWSRLRTQELIMGKGGPTQIHEDRAPQAHGTMGIGWGCDEPPRDSAPGPVVGAASGLATWTVVGWALAPETPSPATQGAGSRRPVALGGVTLRGRGVAGEHHGRQARPSRRRRIGIALGLRQGESKVAKGDIRGNFGSSVSAVQAVK